MLHCYCCLLLTLCIPLAALAQGRATLVGDWRLVSVLQPDTSGATTPFWGTKPLGMFRYSANSVMSAQLYDERRTSLGVSDWQFISPTAARTAFVGLASFYGRFTVDTVAHTESHHVEGAMAPTAMGQILVWERVPE